MGIDSLQNLGAKYLEVRNVRTRPWELYSSGESRQPHEFRIFVKLYHSFIISYLNSSSLYTVVDDLLFSLD